MGIAQNLGPPFGLAFEGVSFKYLCYTFSGRLSMRLTKSEIVSCDTKARFEGTPSKGPQGGASNFIYDQETSCCSLAGLLICRSPFAISPLSIKRHLPKCNHRKPRRSLLAVLHQCPFDPRLSYTRESESLEKETSMSSLAPIKARSPNKTQSGGQT